MLVYSGGYFVMNTCLLAVFLHSTDLLTKVPLIQIFHHRDLWIDASSPSPGHYCMGNYSLMKW